MSRHRSTVSRLSFWGGPPAAVLFSVVTACNSGDSGNSTPDATPDGTSSSGSGSEGGSTSSSGPSSSGGRDGAPSSSSSSGAGSSGGVVEAGPVMCANPGMPTPGPKDTHCALPDGGRTAQPTRASSCTPDVGAPGPSDATTDTGGGGARCGYGPTMFGMESDDDDCKYHVKWTSTPICEGTPGVLFTVIVTHKTDGSPLTGGNLGLEVFTTSSGDWDSAAFCDTMSTHPSIPTNSPNGYWTLTEGQPGTYSGYVAFDQAGQWTIRYHFKPDCLDVLPDSPHGHAAYHISVP